MTRLKHIRVENTHDKIELRRGIIQNSGGDCESNKINAEDKWKVKTIKIKGKDKL